MSIKPVRRNNISNQVFEQLRDQLIQGEWKPGDKLPSENELAEILRVSRVTVRQALQRLAAMELVETRLGEGTFVREPDLGTCMNNMIPVLYLSQDSLLEVLEFRKIFESSTAGLAAEKATEQDIARLEEAYRTMQENQGDVVRFSQADYAFHKELANITKNALVIKTYSIVEDVLETAMERIVSLRGTEDGLHYHRLILDAIRRRDVAESKKIMEEHVERTYDQMVLHLENA